MPRAPTCVRLRVPSCGCPSSPTACSDAPPCAQVRLLSIDLHFEIATVRRTYLLRVDRGEGGEERDGRSLLREGSSALARLSTYLNPLGGTGGAVNGSGTDAAGVGVGRSPRPSLGAMGGDSAEAIQAANARAGKELADWIAALRRAHAMRPDEEGRHHIKRVHLLRSRDADGLLRQVGQKQREHKQLIATPEHKQLIVTPERRATPKALDVSPARVPTAESLRSGAPRGSSATAAGGTGHGLLSAPTEHGGWLWKWDDALERWVRMWCLLQGHALLCYTETYTEFAGSASADASRNSDGAAGIEAAAAGVGAAGADGGATGDFLHSSVPAGVDLERPTVVLWPHEGTLQRSSDAVNAPSPFVFILSTTRGRQHRLCANSATQLQEWTALLEVDGRSSSVGHYDGGGDGGGVGCGDGGCVGCGDGGECSDGGTTRTAAAEATPAPGKASAHSLAPPAATPSATTPSATTSGAAPSAAQPQSPRLETALAEDYFAPAGALPSPQRSMLTQHTLAAREMAHQEGDGGTDAVATPPRCRVVKSEESYEGSGSYCSCLSDGDGDLDGMDGSSTQRLRVSLS